MNALVNPQIIALRNLQREDRESARNFINQTWPVPAHRDAQFKMTSTITYAVCTTPNSSVLLIAKGWDSRFTRNTLVYPWFIFQDVQENEALVRHIQESWDSMAVHPNGDRDEVNKIAPHVLYRKVVDGWEPVPLPEANEENVVRFEIDDMVIWSHPPSDEPLMEVLRRHQQFTQDEVELMHFCENWTAIVNNANIPEDERLPLLEEQRGEIRNSFSNMYTFYENLNPPLNSYVWPTLQLGIQTIRFGNEHIQRFRDNFSGVYENHHKFHASDVQPRPSPTRETMYDLFTSSVERFDLSHEELMRT